MNTTTSPVIANAVPAARFTCRYCQKPLVKSGTGQLRGMDSNSPVCFTSTEGRILHALAV